MKNFSFTVTALLAGVLLSVSALASVVEKVEKDFSPTSGVVVMAASIDEYIIDLDGSSGVAVGDLLAVVEEGAQIVHPVTKKILGTLDKTMAVLQVTQVKTGYSYAKVLEAEASAAIDAGTKLERFSNLSAIFKDETGVSEAMYADLRRALPQLEWQESMSATIADLFFTVTPNGLEVRDSKGVLIRSYAPEKPTTVAAQGIPTNLITAPVVKGTSSATAGGAGVAVVGGAAVNALATSGAGKGAVQYEASPSGETAQATTGVDIFNMEFPRFNKVGQFKKKTVMADFEKVDGKLLLATTDGETIEVFSVEEKLELVATGDSTTMGQILSLSWYQPEAGEAYLAVTVWHDEQISTDLLKLEGSTLAPVIRGYPRMVAGFDVDGDMRSELLLGQEFEREYFYGRRVDALTLRNGKFEASPPPMVLPRSFQIFGALLADITGDGKVEAIYIRKRRLYIFQGTEQIYKSSSEIGGSVSTVTYDVDPDAQNPMINNASIEVAPVAADLNGDGRREIVAPAADGNILRSVGVASAIDNSWLAVFKYRNGMVIKGSVGDRLERPLQGICIANGQAYMLATDVGNLLDSNEASYLLSIPLQ
ncbi:MAG: VCBS repeat-containing protein [Desulfuromonadaceae bacterium]|nr:VCBS repeat-containing protein [Desulfuromonadaceae bacterium]